MKYTAELEQTRTFRLHIEVPSINLALERFAAALEVLDPNNLDDLTDVRFVSGDTKIRVTSITEDSN